MYRGISRTKMSVGPVLPKVWEKQAPPEKWYACLLYSFCCFLYPDPYAELDE
jgi:hypothetical protein